MRMSFTHHEVVEQAVKPSRRTSRQCSFLAAAVQSSKPRTGHYASMNWIRFNGSLRATSSISAPCRDSPGEASRLDDAKSLCQLL